MENNQNKPIGIKDALLKKISSDEVVMRPKIYFTLKLVALGILAFLALILSAFIFNFILFRIHAQATDAFLGFGARGIQPFLLAFPWALLFIDIVCILAFQWLARRFHQGYRKPILWGFIGIFIAMIMIGTAMDIATPVNDFLHTGNHRLVPLPIRNMYVGLERPPRPVGGACLCVITSMGTSTFTAENAALGSTTKFLIIVPAHERHATTSSLSVGDTVMIAGDRNGDVIRAFGIHKIESKP